MKKQITLLLSLFAMVSAITIQMAHAGNQGTGASPKQKSGNITYIDISISQPGVDDCLGMSVPEMGMDSDWISIFPNPNPGKFTLELNLQNTGEPLHIQMYDLSGKVAFETRETPLDSQFRKDLDLSNLEKGLYIIRITGKERVGVKQMIIN